MRLIRFITISYSVFSLFFAQSLSAGCETMDFRTDPARGYRALVLIDAAAPGTSSTAQTLFVYDVSCDITLWKLASSAPITVPRELSSSQSKVYRVQGLALEHVEENEVAWANAIFLDRAFRFWIGSLESRRTSNTTTRARPNANASISVGHDAALLVYQAIKNAGRGDALAMQNENERGLDGSAGPRARGRFVEVLRATVGYRALVAIVDSSRPGGFDAQAAAREPALLRTLLAPQIEPSTD